MALILPHYVLSFGLDLPFLLFCFPTPPDLAPTFVHLMVVIAHYMHLTDLGCQSETKANSIASEPEPLAKSEDYASKLSIGLDGASSLIWCHIGVWSSKRPKTSLWYTRSSSFARIIRHGPNYVATSCCFCSFRFGSSYFFFFPPKIHPWTISSLADGVHERPGLPIPV